MICGGVCRVGCRKLLKDAAVGTAQEQICYVCNCRRLSAPGLSLFEQNPRQLANSKEDLPSTKPFPSLYFALQSMIRAVRTFCD